MFNRQGAGGPVRPPGPPTPPDGIQGPQDRQGVSRGHRATNAHQAAPMPAAGPSWAFVERKSPRAGRALR